MQLSSTTTNSSNDFSWVVGPSIVRVYEQGSVFILEHEGGNAFSIIWKGQYFGCCPSLKYAKKAADNYNGRD